MRWLTDDEKRVIHDDIAHEATQSEHVSVMDALKSTRVWLLGVAYFCIASAIYISVRERAHNIPPPSDFEQP